MNRISVNNSRTLRIRHCSTIFNRDGQGLLMNKFLTSIRCNFNEEELISKNLFFKNNAEFSYWKKRTEFWKGVEFLRSIKKDVLPQNYDLFLLEEIMNTIQQSNESFSRDVINYILFSVICCLIIIHICPRW